MSHEDEYLSVEELIEIQKEETRDIIAALLEDGSDPDSLYEIEHHLFAEEKTKTATNCCVVTRQWNRL